jgi:hypothetical protein
MATRRKGDSFERTLTERQIALLEAFEVRGNVARYTGGDVIPDWKVVKEVFTKLGGTWKRSDGFAFPENVDAAALLANTLATGSIFDPALAGFFPTPKALAERMAQWAIRTVDDVVLEPSAGTGALVRAAQAMAGEAIRVDCIEVQESLAIALDDLLAGRVTRGRFQDQAPTPTYDVVLMNPPFASDEWRDIGHVTHAIGFLKPGGRLAAIVGAGAKFRTTKAHVAFRARLDALGAHWEDLPPDTFREAGTSVRTCLVRLTMPT